MSDWRKEGYKHYKDGKLLTDYSTAEWFVVTEATGFGDSVDRDIIASPTLEELGLRKVEVKDIRKLFGGKQ